MSDSEPSPSNELLVQLMAENAVLKGICGVILAEISQMSPLPSEKLGTLVASIQGYMDATAKMAQTIGSAETQAMSRIASEAVEAICSIAEVVLQSDPANRKK